MKGITKRFPGVIANEGIDFDLRAGEVHTLLGENGAGKSTLMKILFGLQKPDEGQVFLDGKPLDISSPGDAIAAGIGMIHQHFMLVPNLTVTENVALGLGPSLGRTDLKAVAERIRTLATTYGLDVDPDAYIWQLAVGERQRVEILKAVYRDVRLLVLDEPTAVLTPGEVDEFFETLRRLVADGRGLVFISHKLHEVMALSDRITVLRDGRVSGTTVPAETSPLHLAELMVGRAVKLAPDKPPVETGQTRLQIRSLCVGGDRGTRAVDNIDLDVAAGEILGIAGVSGNGQRELAEAIAGLRKVESGTIAIDKTEVSGLNDPLALRRAGLSYVPEERMRDGAVADFSVTENLMLINHGHAPFSERGILKFGAIKEACTRLVEEFAVKTPSLDATTRTLSGGNIQKVIMARELSSGPAVLVAAQPTRGVDIGAAEYIRDRLVAQREDGTAMIVISEDLDEVLALADRVAVMFEGRIVGTVERSDCTPELLGLMMAGADVST